MNKEDEAQDAARAKEKAVIAEVKQEQMEAALAKVREGHPPYEVLGMEGDGIIRLYSRDRQTIARLVGDRASYNAIIVKLADEDALKVWQPEWQDLNEKKLAVAVMKDIVSKLGSKIYDSSKVRGAGIWPDPEGIIYSTGRDCFLQRVGEPAPRPVYPVRPNGIVYATSTPSPNVPFPAASPLSREEGQKLYSLFEARAWRVEGAADMILGWLGCSILAGTLPVRPLVWVNAEHGSGKTEMKKQMVELFSGLCRHASGIDSRQTTVAGVRDYLTDNAVPFFFDELDPKERAARERMAAFISMFRTSFSDEAMTVRHGDGGASAATLRSCACFFSIQNSIEEDSDKSRWCVLRMEHVPAAEAEKLVQRQQELLAQLLHADIAPRLITRMMVEYPSILRNLATIAERLRGQNIEGRRANIHGALQACRWAITNGGLASECYLSHCVESAVKYESLVQEDSEDQAEQLIDKILMAECLRHPRRNVKQCAMALRDPSAYEDHQKECQAALEGMGIYPRYMTWHNGDKDQTWCLVVDQTCDPIKRILKGSNWEGGRRIKDTLHGNPHAIMKQVRLKGGTGRFRILIREAYWK